MKKDIAFRLIAILVIGCLATIASTTFVYMKFSRPANDDIPGLQASHQRIIQSKSDEESLAEIQKEIDDTANDLDTTEIDESQKDLESIDLTGV